MNDALDGGDGTAAISPAPDEIEAPEPVEVEPAERPEAQTPTLEETAEVAREFISGLVAVMGLEAEVTAQVIEGRAHIDVAGDDLGVLIGRRGQTLDALQELTKTAVQRRLRGRARLLVDVEGYRARRRESLVEYAKAMAERAIERGTEIELEPMSSYERKLVHDAVAEVEGATSFSEGEEPNRKVVIRSAAAGVPPA